MREDVPLLRDMNQRRRDLGISYELLSKRCGVSRPTVQRILSGRHTAASFASIVAIAESLGLGLRFDTKVHVRKLAREQAERKATKLVALVQGTSGLEGRRWTKRRSSRWSSEQHTSFSPGRSESSGAKSESLGACAG